MRGGSNFFLSLPDNEAIFADEVVTDGDTRGLSRLIRKQVEICGGIATGIAVQLPDFSHFLNTVSNATYDLAELDKSMKGKDMLDAPHIRAIVGYLARHLRNYHSQLDKRKTKADEMALDDA
jgi:hypothetical protein